MNNHRVWRSLLLILVFVVLFVPLTTCVEATDTTYYMGTAVNTGKDTGYSEENTITDKDPHFGWTLGRFYVSGYTRATTNASGEPVFLKTVGDTITLWFNLEQDIDMLNNNEMLTIYSDSNGYDEYFGIEESEFGRGTLIIRYTDYQNNTGNPVIYTNYLESTATTGADVQVKLLEEGDYEIALNYEIREANLDLFGWDTLPSYHNYRIFFRFSVRNGNCMVYPFDVATGEELLNTAITENGFYLDLAKSRYLDIDIKKEVLNEGANGLTEDVRFNRPARDGEEYTEEGIYTITVSNRYTNQQTVKKIYVGSNAVLKAHVTTGLEIADIAYQLSMGATVAEDGTIIPPPEPEISDPIAEDLTVPAEKPEKTQKDQGEEDEEAEEIEPVYDAQPSTPVETWIFIAIWGLLIAVVIILVVVSKKKKPAANKTSTHEAVGGDDE